jgi:ubiquinone/menaquinone biosynthesis C-methylase UbiE
MKKNGTQKKEELYSRKTERVLKQIASTQAPKKTKTQQSIKTKQTTTSSKTNETSWGPVAEWYRDTVENNDSYQVKVIEPNLLRVLGDVSGKKVLDIACGEGYFSGLLSEHGAKVTGLDIGEELIEIAKQKYKKPAFHHMRAEDVGTLKREQFDIAICVLALQNIEDVKAVFQGVASILKPGGRFILVLNHPVLRNPRVTDWGYDEESNIQYRAVSQYLTESKIQIDMNPGESNRYKKKYTVSFARPLQFFVKQLSKANLHISGLEEWVSHKTSEPGPRAAAENKARHEIPLFMCIESVLYRA